MQSVARGQSRRSSGETPSDRSLRGESRRSDGTATTLHSSRADLAVFQNCPASGTSVRRWGLGRLLLPLAFDLEKSRDMVGARRMARASRAHQTSSWHWSRIGMGLLCAQNVLPNSADSDGKRASWCSHVTLSTGRPSTGLFATAGETASRTLPMRCIRDAGVPQAAAGLCLESCLRWHVRASPW
jgi:hypothetical protein